MKKARWAALGLFLLLSFGAALIGGIATSTSVDTWYPTLNKPSWNPPAAIFTPVWMALYTAMAFAAWRVWLNMEEISRGWTLKLFFVQLLFNAAWSVLFFGLRSPDAAFLDIIILWTLLVILQVRFWRRDRIAGLLWLPYLLWVSFAAVLNFEIWRLN